MMVTTHAAVGVALAAVLLPVRPEFATVAAVAGLLGGVFPDLDLLFEHRKTLHFPAYYWIGALIAGVLVLLLPSAATFALLFFLLAAAVHSVMDIYGGPREFRPWERTSNRAVYLHYGHRWLAPRPGIRYDGAPEELLVVGICSLPGLFLFDGTLRTVTVLGLVVSLLYTAFRGWIPEFIEA